MDPSQRGQGSMSNVPDSSHIQYRTPEPYPQSLTAASPQPGFPPRQSPSPGDASLIAMSTYAPFLDQGRGFVVPGHMVQGQGVQVLGQDHPGQGQPVMGMSRLHKLPGDVQPDCLGGFGPQCVPSTGSRDMFLQRQGVRGAMGPMGVMVGSGVSMPSQPPLQHLTQAGPGQRNVMYVEQAGCLQPHVPPGSGGGSGGGGGGGGGVLHHQGQLMGPGYAQYPGVPLHQQVPMGQAAGMQQFSPAGQTPGSVPAMEGPTGHGRAQNVVYSPGTGCEPHHTVSMAPGTFQPGWIKAQLQTVQRSPGRMIPLPQPQQQLTLHNVGVRPSYLPPNTCSIQRANAVEARFRSLYPMGYPTTARERKCMAAPANSANMQIRHSVAVPPSMLPHDTGQHGRRSARCVSSNAMPMEVDTSSSAARLSRVSVNSPSPMETDTSSGTQNFSLLDVQLQCADGSRSLRHIITHFVERTYSELGRRTYCIPQKPPVNQQHPDKALVRTREGEFRVSMAFEQLSIYTGEAMFILGDYHYESFLYHLNPSKVMPGEQAHMAEVLTQLKREKQFGDFDFLVFHPQCGVIVVGLCSVNSNSDVQYILKRVQKARVQLDKSVSVAQRCLATMGIDCPVMRIFCTPNLKRSFLSKVTIRDKATDKALASIPVLCSNQLPIQFRLKWHSMTAFEVFLEWWWSVKAESLQARGHPLSQEQLTLVVGCFLCPTLSQVDFDQSIPPAPSEWQVLFSSDKSEEPSPMDTTQGRDPADIPKTDLDLSSLSLSIGNVTKPFAQYMEEYVDLYYPNFLEQTYRVPPIHFNIQKISKQRQYEILEMPMSKDTRGDEGENRVVSAIEILGLKYEVVRPVFIICDFQYNNYLNKLKENMFIKGDDRRPRRAYGQSVRAQHDCLLIHRRYGIIIISVKAVGDNFREWASSGNEQWTAVKRTLGKVLKQLPREEKMVNMVLGDLASSLPCIKLIALPNLSRRDINTAVSDDLQLQEEIKTLFPEFGTQAFLCKDELCETQENIWETFEQRPEFFTNLCAWWDKIVGPGKPDVLSPELYKQIIGRFCGLLSTMEVWSVQAPRVEIRSQAEAVHETAERYARILLLPEQVEVLGLLNKFLFLWGPPGSGKTLMLTLRAQRWVSEGGRVVILNMRHGSLGLPLGHLLQKQVVKMSRHNKANAHHHQAPDSKGNDTATRSSKSPDPAPYVRPSPSSPAPATSPSHSPQPSSSPRRHSSPSSSSSSSPVPGASVQRVDFDSCHFSREQPGKLADIPQGAFIVVDEVMKTSHDVLSWIIESCKPKAIWCAGQFEEYCPPGFESRSLTRVLRCPPMVQRVLQHTSNELGVVGEQTKGQGLRKYNQSYVPSSAPHGLATDGSRPWFIFHSQHNSSSPLPLDCKQCGRDLLDIFLNGLHLQSSPSDQAKRRRLGPLPVTGDGLSLKDVVIVSRRAEPCALITALKKGGLAVAVIIDTANPVVAVPTQEVVIFTTPFAMTGLERKVVVYVAFEAKDPLDGGEEEGEEGKRRKAAAVQDDLLVGQALGELTAEDRVSLWYTASRCMGQLIIVVP